MLHNYFPFTFLSVPQNNSVNGNFIGIAQIPPTLKKHNQMILYRAKQKKDNFLG